MFRTALLMLVFGLAQRALVHPPLEPRSKVALVVGNSRYREYPLINPVNDARAMRDILANELGFAVELSADANYKELGKSIDRFVQRLRRGDVALFYYAGHGIQIEGENYLIPTDFDARDESDAKYAGYPVARLAEGMERTGAKLVIIVLDACRNNPYRGSRAAGGGLAPIGTGAGTFIAFAASPGKTASDNSGEANGLFTKHLIEALKQPGYTLDEVFNLTREKVSVASNRLQVPWSSSNVIGTFYFHPPQDPSSLMDIQLRRAPRTGLPTVEPPKAPDTYRVGVTESRSGDHANAIVAFTQAIRTNPENLEAYYERAMTYAALGQFQHAIDDFNQVVLRNPKSADALIGRAASFINVSDYGRASTDLNSVISQEPENVNAYFDRGLARAGSGQYRKAIEDYTQVIRRRPKWPTTWYNRGIVYAASGDFKSAITDYTEAVRLRPDYASAYANRGVSSAELGDFPRALADLNEAITRAPGDAAMLNSRGMVLLGMHEPSKAVKEFDEAIRLNPLLAIAYFNRAEARRLLGDEAGAQTDLKRARELGVR